MIFIGLANREKNKYLSQVFRKKKFIVLMLDSCLCKKVEGTAISNAEYTITLRNK